MWLIMTSMAAIVATAVWYAKAPHDEYKLGFLSLMFWGATIMWLVDHVVAYVIEGGEFFEVSLDSTLLGVCVVLAGLLLWEIVLLASDPKGVMKRALKR